MKQHQSTFGVAAQCRYFGVSRSGFYAWLNRKPSARLQWKQRLDQEVKQCFEQHKQRYGAQRIQRELQRQNQPYDIKTIAASLRRQGLVAKAARTFKATTNSRHTLPVFENLLNQDFTASQPNQKWVSDITYLATAEGWVYLAVVIDLYSRRVIGWSMAERMTTELACAALRMAIAQRKRPINVIVHSDRGSQYCSHAYRELLEKHQLIGSMSAKGNCYDNACAESFFHSFKVETIHGEYFATRENLKQTVFEYLEVDYNRTRLHAANDYQSPVDFERATKRNLAS